MLLRVFVTTSGPMVERINGRRYGTLRSFTRFGEKFRNFMELSKGSDGTEQLCIKPPRESYKPHTLRNYSSLAVC